MRRLPTITPPPTYAGGVPAITSITRLVLEQVGPFRAVRLVAGINQHDGFDCPGCAWPDPATPGRLEFCENGMKAAADEATYRRAKPAFFAHHDLAALRALPDVDLNGQGRLTHPLVRRPGTEHYVPIAWDAAIALIAAELKATPPDRAVFYTSGRTSNEAAFLYQLFVRRYGTNNLPDCSNMCHESSGVALTETLGVGKGSVTLEDLQLADAIFVFGQNPGSNHPRMLTALQEAKRNGCRIVAINPLREPGLLRFKHPKEWDGLVGDGTEIADLYLQVRANGDVALLKGLCKALLELDRAEPNAGLDHGFIRTFTSGYDALVADLDASTWPELVEASGVPEAQIREAAAIAAEAEGLICTWAMGLTQHVNAVANIQSVVNLLLLRGAVGKPGAGVCPVRGHSNVQGDRTMGIWERPPPSLLRHLRESFGFEPPTAHGYDTVHAIQAMLDGQVDVLFAMGGNLLSAAPDTERVAEALARCRLTVHVSTKPNRSHLHPGATSLILPTLGRTDLDLQASGPQFVTVEDSMGVVHRSQGRLPPPSADLRSEPAIVCALAHAVLGPTPVDWLPLADDYDRIRDLIARTLPGFFDYNARVRRPGGFVLPHPVRDSRTFRTSDDRAQFTVHPLPQHDLRPNELLMMTIRSHDQYNTTVYTNNDRYRGLHGQRRVVLVAPTELARLGLARGDTVRIISRFRGVERAADGFTVVPYDLPPGACATYFPEANCLVPLEQFADRSHTPASKSVVVRLERA
jgi:molybdopterin-dependent oxidoreductase alpha subunit